MEKMFIKILEEELIPALGCTEPMAISFATAKACEVLGNFPERIEVLACNNIVKNVKGVTIPNSNGLKGMSYSAILGAVVGNSERKLEILSSVSEEDIERAKSLKESEICKVLPLESESSLHLVVRVFLKDEESEVEIKDGHCNIIRISKNGKAIFEKADEGENGGGKRNFKLSDIYDFVQSVDVEKIKKVILRQIEFNMRIAEEGLSHSYGKGAARALLENYPNDVNARARGYAGAASEARMNGCSLPVVINSGSGNQGITVSVPIYVFAKEYGKSEEKMIRAVALSNLVGVYLKRGIGKLSAYCGVVSASSGVAAGIAYLMNGCFKVVSMALSNTVANVAGIICDGAKSSCAAKIMSSIDAALLAYYMATKGNSFDSGDGIIGEDIEGTIRNVIRVGKDGMGKTDEEIISIMLEDK